MVDDVCATPWNSLGSNSSHTEFFLSDNGIQTTSITKDLGAEFESNLKFKARINDIVSLGYQRSALIHCAFLSRDTYNLILAFKTRVRPLLDCVSPVWSQLTSCWSALLSLYNSDLLRNCKACTNFHIQIVCLSLDFNLWTATDYNTLKTEWLCHRNNVHQF